MTASQIMYVGKNGITPADFDPLTLEAISSLPECPSTDSAWQGHVPFALWLVREMSPSVLVELGVHYGQSYLAMCHAIRENGLPTRAFGIDSWLGDEHAGYYGEEVYINLKKFHDPQFSEFSTLVRSTFEEANDQFESDPIDILHIDGLHTYEAVRNDFEAWKDKMSRRGVILFHDTQVKENGFGVWKLWDELSQQYPSFEFHHSFGLGVLCIGLEIHSSLRWLTNLSAREAAAIRTFFGAMGHRVQIVNGRNSEAEHFRCEIEHLRREKQDFQQNLDEERQKIQRMRGSFSWKITRPLRKISKALRIYPQKS